MKVGTRIDLAKHSLTKSRGLRGQGIVTAIRKTDPVNDRYLVIVKTPNGYLHLNSKGIQ